MDDIFEPRVTPLISDAIFGILTEKPVVRIRTINSFYPSRSSSPIYEEEIDDTPWNWYTTDQRNWVAQGTIHIPFIESWWEEFIDYKGLFIESWGDDIIKTRSYRQQGTIDNDADYLQATREAGLEHETRQRRLAALKAQKAGYPTERKVQYFGVQERATEEKCRRRPGRNRPARDR